jgi:predicted SAM-dependent methyltransferase
MSAETMPRRLHIGGQIATPGWEVLDANPAPYVDHVCNARDLSQFDANTFVEVYASHVVEHFDYKYELSNTLAEWNRVLTPGGRIYISVPDMDTLARLFLDRVQLNEQERFEIMRMMFGGHLDKYDYHVVGLNEEFLAKFLQNAGYVNIEKVQSLGVFEDTSSMLFRGVPISLNMTAEKPMLKS